MTKEGKVRGVGGDASVALSDESRIVLDRLREIGGRARIDEQAGIADLLAHPSYI